MEGAGVTTMSNQGDPRAGADQPVWRRHDGDGVSQEAHRLIKLHGLRRSKVLECADHYELKKGIDFNLAPARDFKDVPLGRVLARAMSAEPAFAPYEDKFNDALISFDYATSDGIIDRCLMGSIARVQSWKILYDKWREYVERLEGFNVALFRAARMTAELHRFILDFGELGNYLRGRWRMPGNEQNRVPTTVGESNRYVDDGAVAKVTYDASAIRGWIQPVRYSPYPRNLVTELEQFGHEKDGAFAEEGEVHLHTGCPIPSRDHIKIGIMSAQGRGRQEIVDRYGGAGVIEW